MEFVVLLLSVLAITFTNVIARSIDTEDHTKNRRSAEGDIYEKFKYVLPVAAYNLGDNYEIEIHGTLDLTHKNFAANLLSGESASCKLNFNYEKNSGLEISSEFKTDKDFINHHMEDVQTKTLNPKFNLTLRAKENSQGYKLFVITFMDNTEVGNCEVNRLDNLSHILFKEGVKKIQSLKFTLLEKDYLST